VRASYWEGSAVREHLCTQACVLDASGWLEDVGAWLLAQGRICLHGVR
jgi:hypothetical protein